MRGALNGLVRARLSRAQAWYFDPAPAARLALLRIAIGAFAINHLASRWQKLMDLGDSPAGLFEPVGIVSVLSAPLPGNVHRLIVAAALLFAVAFFAGFRFRVSGPVFALLQMWLLTYRNSWSMIFHFENALVIHVLILGFARSADAYSIDATGRPTPETDAEYGWPIKLMGVSTALMYGLAGYVKITGYSWHLWLTGEVIGNWVAWDTIRKELLGTAGSPFARVLWEHRPLGVALSYLTLVLEIGWLFVFFRPRAARVWSMLTWGMHAGILAFMNIRFPYHLWGLIFLCFFHVECAPAIAARVWRKVGLSRAVPFFGARPPAVALIPREIDPDPPAPVSGMPEASQTPDSESGR
ncbi:hypothetical protein K8I61_01575 [bacterium]|nr:hypothetical protein [bacterium]